MIPKNREKVLISKPGNSYEGVLLFPPTVGSSLFLVIDVEKDQVLQTSTITDVIDKDYGCDIHTRNSVYRVEILEKASCGCGNV